MFDGHNWVRIQILHKISNFKHISDKQSFVLGKKIRELLFEVQEDSINEFAVFFQHSKGFYLVPC